MLQIKLTGSEKVVAALRDKPVSVVAVLSTKLDNLMKMLSSYIVTTKLSGNPLHRRTGVLSGSVHAIPTTAEGTLIRGGVEGAGGPAFYGAIHETGGSRFYPIFATKARALAFIAGGHKIFVRPPAMVIHPPAQARPFMQPSLDENAADIQVQLQTALDAVANKE